MIQLGTYGNSSSGRSFFLVLLRIFSLYVGSIFPVETSFSYRPFRVCFLITSMTFNFTFSYIFNLAIKPILLLIMWPYGFGAKSVDWFGFYVSISKISGEFKWPIYSHMPTLGPVTKGMSHNPSGLLAGKVIQKGGVGKRK